MIMMTNIMIRKIIIRTVVRSTLHTKNPMDHATHLSSHLYRRVSIKDRGRTNHPPVQGMRITHPRPPTASARDESAPLKADGRHESPTFPRLPSVP